MKPFVRRQWGTDRELRSMARADQLRAEQRKETRNAEISSLESKFRIESAYASSAQSPLCPSDWSSSHDWPELT